MAARGSVAPPVDLYGWTSAVHSSKSGLHLTVSSAVSLSNEVEEMKGNGRPTVD